MASSNEKGKGQVKLSVTDYNLIVDWLERPGNRDRLQGSEKNVKVGSKPVVKSKAYAELAKFLNESQKKGSTLVELTGTSLRSRYTYFFNRYRKAKAKSEATGFGLTEKDIAAGITTVEAKLERLCPAYHRMHALWAKNPNVDPLDEFEPGLDEDIEEGEPDIAGESDMAREVVTGEGAQSTAENLQGAMPSLIPPGSMQEVDEELDVGDDEQSSDGDERGRSSNPSPVVIGSVGPRNPSPPATDPGSPVEEVTTRSKKKRKVGEDGSRSYSEGAGRKPVLENRNSMNVAFAQNLESISIQRERANELKEKRYFKEQDIEGKKLEWEKERTQANRLHEKERFERERQERVEMRSEERAEKKYDAQRAECQQMRLAILSSGRPLEEIKQMFKLVEMATTSEGDTRQNA